MKIYCILSDERAFRSKSPTMHNAVFRQLDMNAVYVPFHVATGQLGIAINGLRALNVAGANVTVPFKERAIPYLDVLSEEVLAIGAVNTIVSRNGQLHGHNTDVQGFVHAVREAGYDPSDRTALVFGTGGAARGVSHALKMMGADVVVAGRDFQKAQAVAHVVDAGVVDFDFLRGEKFRAELVVNVTSISSRTEAPEFATTIAGLQLQGCEFVADVNYGRPDNFWAQLASDTNSQFMDGIPMLAHQARQSLRLWSGREVSADLFRNGLEQAQ
jgi:shikimate dehydrogenase